MGKPKKQKDNDFILTSFQETDEVTGSAFMLEIPKEELVILFDCGLFQSSCHNAKETFDINKKRVKMPWNRITHVIISHAHYDHCSALPLTMIKELGFNGKIICTEASQPLISPNCRDSAFVMEAQAKSWNKNNPKKQILPLY